MAYTRETQVINIVIQLPNAVQPVNGMPIVMTAADIIRLGDQAVGYPQQRQQHVIPTDLTPELLSAVNAQLSVIGYQLTPIEGQ